MSKETILKEFIQELLEDVILGKSENESVSVFRKNISIKVNDFYSKISSQTREETIREEIKRKEEMIITKDNAEELVHTPLCKENPEKGNNHFFCNITNADYFRNQVILEDIKYLKELLNKLKK